GPPDVNVQVEVAPGSAHSGAAALHLAATAHGESPPLAMEIPPVWISSPELDVSRGDLILLHGFAKVPKEITASPDGFVILDSLSGEPLSERIGATKDWHEFGLLRAAPENGRYSATFVLTGLGEVWLDDVSLHVL